MIINILTLFTSYYLLLITKMALSTSSFYFGLKSLEQKIIGKIDKDHQTLNNKLLGLENKIDANNEIDKQTLTKTITKLETRINDMEIIIQNNNVLLNNLNTKNTN
jgi:hypothetical protein